MEELRAHEEAAREEFDLGAAERNALQKELAVVAASSRDNAGMWGAVKGAVPVLMKKIKDMPKEKRSI